MIRKESSEIIVNTDNGVATVTINRPEKLNSLNSDGLLLLCQAIVETASNKAVKVIILTGAGDRAFVDAACGVGFLQRADQAEWVAVDLNIPIAVRI